MKAKIKDGKELRLSAECAQMTDNMHYLFRGLMTAGAPASLAGYSAINEPLARTKNQPTWRKSGHRTGSPTVSDLLEEWLQERERGDVEAGCVSEFECRIPYLTAART